MQHSTPFTKHCIELLLVLHTANLVLKTSSTEPHIPYGTMQMLRYSSVTAWEKAAELILYRSLLKGQRVHSLGILSQFYITLHVF
jgi:hypothetical protein